MIRTICLLLLCLAFAIAPASPPSPPPLMLATGYKAGVDVSEYWVSEKLDGVRGHWDGQQLWTRGGHLIPAPGWFTNGWPTIAMDGELWLGRGRFEQASTTIRTGGPDDPAWRAMRFMVFDLPAHGGRFDARVRAMRSLLAGHPAAWLRPVVQFRVADPATLDARLKAVVATGGEGLMLHHRDAHYGAGRSDWLLKYKPYEDAEARVVGHTAGTGKYTGMLGALVVERADGLRFRLGSGFTDAQRADPPPLGAWVTYRHNGLTSNGVPRFARFVRIRHTMPPADPR